MTSSTSLSEPRMPTMAFRLLVVAALTWVICVVYTLWLNPEIRFFSQLAAVQDAWSQKMDREHGHKVVVFGGSSCTFSIIGERMLERYDLPTVNRGLAVGMQVKVPTLNALQDMRRGDTLIVALEPALLTAPYELSLFAAQFGFARRHPGWVTRPALGLPGNGKASTLLALRPSSQHAVILLGKIVQGRALYRYRVADASPSGWMHTPVRLPLNGPPGHGSRVSKDMQRFLSALRDTCSERGIRVAYSLPWGYTPAEGVGAFRKENAGFLLQVAEFIPVLKDPMLGADAQGEHFADTVWHLNEEGSRLRTDVLGSAVKNWDVWSLEELRSLKLGE